MRHLWFIFAPIALLFAVVAYAQQSVQTRSGDAGPIVFDTSGNAVFGTGHIISTAPAPALSACGGGSPAIIGSDLAGTVTTGTTATGCVITFARAWTAAPTCVLGPSSGVLASFSWVITTASITVTQTSSSGNIIQYVCMGKQ